jgi:hypothetical protein
VFPDSARELLAPLADATGWDSVIGAQPGLRQAERQPNAGRVYSIIGLDARACLHSIPQRGPTWSQRSRPDRLTVAA